jgi:hypothetical protein
MGRDVNGDRLRCSNSGLGSGVSGLEENVRRRHFDGPVE